MSDVPASPARNSCLYVGEVYHRRVTPFEHAFQYHVFLMYLDLAELPDLFKGRWLWSSRRAAVARFRREDHLGDAHEPLDVAVRQLVSDRLNFRPAGPIRLLTHLRYYGYVMNPVSFYYCFDAAGERVEAVVAEVNNTPWGERHCYVLDWRERGTSPILEARQSKDFHVSPFMPMDMEYRWRLTQPGDELMVHLENWREDQQAFQATLSLQRRPITSGNLARVLVTHPWMTAQVTGAIYWQALKLWWKWATYHPHPKTLIASPPSSASEVRLQPEVQPTHYPSAR